MVFPIVGGNQATGDFITNSLRFNYADSPKLIKSGTSVGSTTFTFSAWVKFTMSDTYNFVFCAGNQVGLAKDRAVSNNSQFYLNGATGGTYTNSDGYNRDPSAWYHVVVSCNSGTGIIYVNNDNRKGSINIPQLGDDLAIGHFMRTDGVETPQYDYYMDGYMSEVHFVDGTALNPSSFAETNDNGVWVPKDCKNDLTYGSNGFYLQFKETGTSANASGIGADTSGNDNHFTPTNLAAIDVTTDTPQNNFATWNPLDPNRDNDLSEGNTQYVSPTSAREQIRSTFGLTSGKWYWETKPTTANGGLSVGVLKENASMTLDDSLGKDAYGWSYDSDGSSRHSNSSTSSGFDTYTSNDIIGVALDLDNHEIFFYKNGTAQNSGNKAFDLDTGETYFAACGSNSNGSTETFQVNFGNAPFSISSSNSDANGHGSFEYAVPSGYFALCTKNLAEYG
jgi:hypothetical protein